MCTFEKSGACTREILRAINMRYARSCICGANQVNSLAVVVAARSMDLFLCHKVFGFRVVARVCECETTRICVFAYCRNQPSRRCATLAGTPTRRAHIAIHVVCACTRTPLIQCLNRFNELCLCARARARVTLYHHTHTRTP